MKSKEQDYLIGLIIGNKIVQLNKALTGMKPEKRLQILNQSFIIKKSLYRELAIATNGRALLLEIAIRQRNIPICKNLIELGAGLDGLNKDILPAIVIENKELGILLIKEINKKMDSQSCLNIIKGSLSLLLHYPHDKQSNDLKADFILSIIEHYTGEFDEKSVDLILDLAMELQNSALIDDIIRKIRIKSTFQDDSYLLYYSIKKNNVAFAEMLLKKYKMNPALVWHLDANKVEVTPLIMSTELDYSSLDKSSISSLFLTYEANVYHRLKLGYPNYSALEFAMINERISLYREILQYITNDKKISSEYKNQFLSASLNLALQSGNIDYIKAILDAGASTDVISISGTDLLPTLVSNNKILCTEPSDKMMLISPFNTVLACLKENSDEIIKLLLDYGATPFYEDVELSSEFSPINVCIEYDLPGPLALFINKFEDIFAQRYNQEIMLYLAMKQKSAKTLKLLVDYIDLNERFPTFNHTPLFLSIKYDFGIEDLLTGGVDVNSPVCYVDEYPLSALSVAMLLKKVSLVRQLIACGATIKDPFVYELLNPVGMFPDVVQSNEMIYALFEHKEDRENLNHFIANLQEGKVSPLMSATIANCPAIVDAFAPCATDFNIIYKTGEFTGENIAFVAAWNNFTSILNIFKDYPIDWHLTINSNRYNGTIIDLVRKQDSQMYMDIISIISKKPIANKKIPNETNPFLKIRKDLVGFLSASLESHNLLKIRKQYLEHTKNHLKSLTMLLSNEKDPAVMEELRLALTFHLLRITESMTKAADHDNFSAAIHYIRNMIMHNNNTLTYDAVIELSHIFANYLPSVVESTLTKQKSKFTFGQCQSFSVSRKNPLFIKLKLWIDNYKEKLKGQAEEICVDGSDYAYKILKPCEFINSFKSAASISSLCLTALKMTIILLGEVYQQKPEEINAFFGPNIISIFNQCKHVRSILGHEFNDLNNEDKQDVDDKYVMHLCELVRLEYNNIQNSAIDQLTFSHTFSAT